MYYFTYHLWLSTLRFLNVFNNSQLSIKFKNANLEHSLTELHISRDQWNNFLNLLCQENIQSEYGLLEFRDDNRNEFVIHYDLFRRLWVFLRKDNFLNWNNVVFYY